MAADGHADSLTDETSARLAGRSRRLLADLLRPYSRVIKWLMVIVVIENAARLSIPYLVKVGIDSGIPPIQESNDLEPLLLIVGAMLVATIVQAITRQLFLVRSGTIGQDLLFEIRQRVFRHFQRLSPAFHDDYTSGRVISRQTSDVDAIYEMLETGFDGLVTAALTLVGTAALLLFLDVKLGLVALVCGPFLAWLTNWFRKSSAKSYRLTREKVALVIVHFVESMSGIRAVQAFRREPRNQEIFDDVNEQYRAANLVAFRLVAWFMPGIRLIGNITIARRAHLRRLPRLPRPGHRRRARGVPALPAPVLRADDGDQPVLQHLPVGLGSLGEALGRARGGAVGPRAGRTPSRCPTLGARCASTTSTSPTSRACRCCPTST